MNDNERKYIVARINDIRNEAEDLKNQLKRLEVLRSNPLVKEFIALEATVAGRVYLPIDDKLRELKPYNCTHDIFVWEESRKETKREPNDWTSIPLVWLDKDIVKVRDKVYPITEDVSEVTHFSFYCLECGRSVFVPLEEVRDFLKSHTVLNVNENISYDKALKMRAEYYKLLEAGLTTESAITPLKDILSSGVTINR